MVFGSTISHPTPYDIPASYKGYPVSIPEWARKRMKFSDEFVLNRLRAYQYAKNSLGELIKQIISSPLGKNTIIVATGDHNIRQKFEYPQADLFMQYSVTLLIYIPPKYRLKIQLIPSVLHCIRIFFKRFTAIRFPTRDIQTLETAFVIPIAHTTLGYTATALLPIALA
ncbi:MAG TPA: hypothetical protein ENN49_01715 [Bacteroidales bacterium]|nr:hypothetical protein [Bacteroidales bacterium]